MAQARPFNLTRWFSLLSFVCVASISAASALLLSNFLTDRMLHRDAVVTMEFVQAMVASDSAAAYFLAGGSSGAPRDLEETFKDLAQMPDVLRANVFARSRTIVWSSDPSLVGKKFDINPELDEALAAELVVNSGPVRKEEHVAGVRQFSEKSAQYFIETYVPLWDRERRNVIGVVELYRTPDALFEAIHSGSRLIWFGAVVGALFLYGVLFSIVRRAHNIMREQARRLAESESLAAIGEMASAVAHAIRNPLAVIRSSAELVADTPECPGRDSAQDIVFEVDQVERTVRELLTYSRPPSEKTETIELNPIIQKSLRSFGREMDRRRVEIRTRLEDPLPAVRGDSVLIGQVLNSLIANALDAMSAPGRLTVESSLAGDRRHIRVSISDTGSGIAAQELANIFKPFHTTKPKGLGLGLPLARRILERHGGTLDVASAVGSGTTVTLQLIATN